MTNSNYGKSSLMPEQKLCPLANPGTVCRSEACAWWRVGSRQCVIPVLTASLEALSEIMTDTPALEGLARPTGTQSF